METKRRNIIKALKLAGNSSPGPDGVPFAAWRALGNVGVDLLQEIAAAVRHEYSHNALAEAYHGNAPAVNTASISVRWYAFQKLRKATTLTWAYYKPNELRPLGDRQL